MDYPAYEKVSSPGDDASVTNEKYEASNEDEPQSEDGNNSLLLFL